MVVFSSSRLILAGLSSVLLSTTVLAAELEISSYAGFNGTHDSDVTIGPDTHADIIWDGESFTSPIYWGIRTTVWFDSAPNWGLAIDFAHAKVAAENLPADVTRLEFTDGLNILTANALYRWEDMIEGTDVYVGAGAGLTIPHLEVSTEPGHGLGDGSTFNYHVGGPAAQILAGARTEIAENLHLFGEYKLSASWVDAPIHNGGRVSTDLVTHHAIVGLSYTFEGFGSF